MRPITKAQLVRCANQNLETVRGRNTLLVRWSSAALAIAIVLSSAAEAASGRSRIAYPAAPVRVVRDTLHGTVVEDPYRWLEDQDAPETRAWIDHQDAFCDSVLAHAPGRETIRARLNELMRVESRSVPVERGGRLFFTRQGPDQDYPVLIVRERDGRESVLLDPNAADSADRRAVSFYAYAEDGSRVALAFRRGGEDEVEIRFVDVAKPTVFHDPLPKARYFNLAIARDGTGCWYARFDPEGPRVYHHAAGSEAASDRLVFGAGYGREKIIGLDLSDDGRYLALTVLHGAASTQTEVHLLETTSGAVRPVVTDLPATFQARFGGDRLYLRTNWQAPNERILAVDPEHPERDQWREVVPAGPHVIGDFEPAGGRLCVLYLEDVRPRVRQFYPDGREAGTIEFPLAGSVSRMRGRWNSDDLYFEYESFFVPGSILRYALGVGTRETWWAPQVPIDDAAFTVEQVACTSKDGTRVPMFLAHRKDAPRDGRRPTYLTGYGGFRQIQTPRYSAASVLWMEQGGVWALACMRGGSEFGEPWHEAGMLDRKQNVFDDFIASAEWLIRKRWTRRASLAISGGSNGGLLVGAAMTQRPELFQAVVCSVPLLDMLRYQRFLVARFWVPEYGTAEDPAQFPYLAAYSPYQRVRPGTRYPAVLFMSGDSDTRVDPLHARKMAARLQAATASDRPVLLHYDRSFGHSRGSLPLGRRIDDETLRLQFLLWQLGALGSASGGGSQPGAPRPETRP